MAEVQKDSIGSTEDTLRFLDMISLFSSQAMIGLGKVVNPATGTAGKNLPIARLFIDTLEMIERKTQGNLTAEETKVLATTLTDLRLMYAEEAKSPTAPASAGQKPPPPPAPEPEQTDPPDSKVKFHKKYE
jgi:hypothetical protein